VHAVVLLTLGALPKTSSGKVRRQTCRAAFADGTLDDIHRWIRPALHDEGIAHSGGAAHNRSMSVVR
jgi:hypothetical protein